MVDNDSDSDPSNNGMRDTKAINNKIIVTTPSQVADFCGVPGELLAVPSGNRIA